MKKMRKWIAEFELEDGDTMPEHMDLEYEGAKIDFHCRTMWIPCSERLPIIENNNRARVLITTSWGFVKEAYYCVDHWEINDIDFILTSVIAWMPLPEPYEEGEQNV